jgi:hypothetical protein
MAITRRGSNRHFTVMAARRRLNAVACCHALGLALLLTSAEASAQSSPALSSGVYGELLLAVDKAGNISGLFSETRGQGVTFTCDIELYGKSKSAKAHVTANDGEKVPATIEVDDGGVLLTIKKGDQLAGCGMAVGPLFNDGAGFSQNAATTWSSIRRIARPRVYFFADAARHEQMKAYVVEHDPVGVVAAEGDSLQVEYWSDGVMKAKGWIKADDTAGIPTQW